MARGVRWYLVGSVVLGSLAVLAGCGGGRYFAEREPWRGEAEVSCINSGAVKEGAGKVRIKAISGPGACGADYPLKVSAIGDGVPIAYSDELRPPSSIPNASSMPPRWPGASTRAPAPYEGAPAYPTPSAVEARPLPAPGGPPPYEPPARYQQTPRYEQPLSLDPRGASAQGGAPEPYDFRRPYGVARPPAARAPVGAPLDANSPAYDLSPEPYDRRRVIEEPSRPRRRSEQSLAGTRPVEREGPPTPALGRALPVAAGPVSVSPAATLACPLVSQLDQWIAGSVQPAALRWFGQPVVEIKQISAYSCRGMNGNPNARISEHAFGNALDIASFTLASGRKVTVKNGWNGEPEEQGFLRDVQGAACDQFTTVLAPGSNAYHYDHIHVDLMRRNGGRRACNPHAVSGEEVAARVRGRYAGRSGEVTGSTPRGKRVTPSSYVEEPKPATRNLPVAVPGEDGED